jgi:hypothetical protein
MLEALKRWMAGSPTRPGYAEVEDWATARQLPFKRARDGEGFVVDAVRRNPPWRLEWGPSQRPYLPGQELRLRGEVGGAPELHMLVLSRSLMEALERRVFEDYTGGLQTRIDTATPEEMRWLVLSPKPPVSPFKELRDRFGGVANHAEGLAQWLEGPFAAKLAEAASTWLAADAPLVLVVQRARLTLRMACPRPDVKRMERAMWLFEVALREARRVAERWESAALSVGDTTQPSLWGREGPPTG